MLAKNLLDKMVFVIDITLNIDITTIKVTARLTLNIINNFGIQSIFNR